MADEINEDVKTETTDSSSEADVSTDSSSEEEVFEGENRAIPYSRFKEKATEARELKMEIEALKEQNQTAVNETAAKMQSYYEGELSKMERSREEDVDIYDEPKIEDKIAPLMRKIEELGSTISSMKSESATERLKTQITSLKTVYPELEDEHVLVVKKAKPNLSLEECAEYSHKYFEDRLKSKYSAMIAKKKEAAKKPIMTADGSLDMPVGEKPKTFKEAKKRMMEYAKQLDRR